MPQGIFKDPIARARNISLAKKGKKINFHGNQTSFKKGEPTKYTFKKGYDSRRTGFQKGHEDFNTEESHKRTALRNTGEKNKLWKGEDAGYCAKHTWIYRQKGKAKYCEDCGMTDQNRRYNWSNIDHKYRRKVEDYISRCIPCHFKYDVKMGLIKKDI